MKVSFCRQMGIIRGLYSEKKLWKIQQIEKRILPGIPRIQHGQLLSLLPEVLAISDSPSEN